MFSRFSLIVAQTSSRRAQIVTSLPASASTSENAVPQEPAPKTATLLMLRLLLPTSVLRSGCRSAVTPALRGSKRSAGALLAADLLDERGDAQP